MLEKIIIKLKNILPGQKASDEDFEEDQDQEENSSEEPESSLDGENAKKKQISMLIRIFVILGIGYMAVDHFFLSAQKAPTVEEMIAANAPKKKRKKIEVETTSAEKVTDISTPNSVTTDTANTADESSPVENINIMDKAETVTQTSTPTEISSPVVEDNIDQRIDQLIDNADQSEPVAESITESIGEKTSSENIPKKEEKVSMADMIVQEDVYTPAPQYDQIGRGLVYNCKDKYWACVDKPAYVGCNKNMLWNKSKGNTVECVVQNIYGSDEDCAKIQKYNVSTNVATSFCGN